MRAAPLSAVPIPPKGGVGRRTRLPCEPGRPLSSASHLFCGDSVVGEGSHHALGQPRAVRLDQVGRVATDLGQRGTPGGHDGDAGRHALEGGEAEPLVERGNHDDGRRAEEPERRLVVQSAHEHGVRERVKEAIPAHIRRSHEDERRPGMGGPDDGPRRGQPVEVLAPGATPGMEDERSADTELGQVVLGEGSGREEAAVHPVVDHHDACGPQHGGDLFGGEV